MHIPSSSNSDVESIIKANDICDRYGIDTISAGSAIAFAMECYEKGIIDKGDTAGIELTWGNAAAIIAMLEKMVKREGLGNILADGVDRAARQIGKPTASADLYTVDVAEFDRLVARCGRCSAEELGNRHGLPFADAETLIPAASRGRAAPRPRPR